MKAGNGEIIATSQLYASADSARVGIQSVRNNAAAPIEDQTVKQYAVCTNPKFEVYTDKAGLFRFRLIARNGNIIAASQGYVSKQSCLNGIASLMKNAPTAKIVEEK